MGGLENQEDVKNVQVGVLRGPSSEQKETRGFPRASGTVGLGAGAGAVRDTGLQLELTQGQTGQSRLFSKVASRSPSQHPFLLKREASSLF